jgi:hypothetical protein
MKTVKRGSGRAELFSVLKMKKEPPKSATANRLPVELKTMPQFVMLNRDWV